MKKEERIIFRTSAKLKKQLEKRARVEKRTVSDYLRLLLSRVLAEGEIHEIKNTG